MEYLSAVTGLHIGLECSDGILEFVWWPRMWHSRSYEDALNHSPPTDRQIFVCHWVEMGTSDFIMETDPLYVKYIQVDIVLC